jgi:hypothetical protein
LIIFNHCSIHIAAFCFPSSVPNVSSCDMYLAALS